MSGSTPLRIAIAPIGKREISEAFKKNEPEGTFALSMDRRRHYRVDAHDATPLMVTLLVEGDSHRADMVNASYEGVQVSLPVKTAPAIAVGRRVQLRFAHAAGGSTFEAEGEVRSSAVKESLRLFGFAFVDEALHSLSDGVVALGDSRALWSVFNRRRTPRVAPDPTELPVQVELTVPGVDDSVRVVPVDLSLRGIAIAAGAEITRVLNGEERVEMTIHLPNAIEPLVVRGTIKNAHMALGHTRFGIEFDRDASSDSEDGRTALASWIHERIEALKRA